MRKITTRDGYRFTATDDPPSLLCETPEGNPIELVGNPAGEAVAALLDEVERLTQLIELVESPKSVAGVEDC